MTFALQVRINAIVIVRSGGAIRRFMPLNMLCNREGQDRPVARLRRFVRLTGGPAKEPLRRQELIIYEGCLAKASASRSKAADRQDMTRSSGPPVPDSGYPEICIR
jgi:hypothetical protein